MIKEITKAYIRHYRDNGQTTAYVEWIDDRGETGRTEGRVLLPDHAMNPKRGGPTMANVYGAHMGTLLARAICNGVPIERDTW